MLNARNEEKECGNLFILSMFCEYSHLEYVRIHVIYGVNQANHVIHVRVVAPQEYVNTYSTCRPVTCFFVYRAATRISRWFRIWLGTERMRMLVTMQTRVLAVNANRLYVPTALYESLRGKLPLHASRLWPEHRLLFSFSAKQELQLSVNNRMYMCIIYIHIYIYIYIYIKK